MAAGAFITSCGQKEDEPQQTTTFTVTPLILSLDPQGGQEYIFITSAEDWLLRSDAKWIKVVTSSGKGSASPVKASITYEANTTGFKRETILTIRTLSGKTEQVQVSQEHHVGPIVKRGITSANDLLAFATAVNEGTSLTSFLSEGKVILLNDIDASSIETWTPVGTSTNPFTGIFDGNGYTIKNVKWSVDASKYPDVGIFGYASNATIQDLNVGETGSECTITGSSTVINVGAIVGRLSGGDIARCSNNLTISYKGEASGANVSIAGICGRSDGTVSACTNSGNVLCPVVCRAAGFVANNTGKVKNCINNGAVLAETSGDVGPAWACSYNSNPANFIKNTGNGHVGSYALYKDSPTDADSDAYLNAVVSPATGGYVLEEAVIDNKKDSYYNWKVVNTTQVSSGVKYTHYDCTTVPRKVHVLEIDLSNPAVEVTTSYANDCVPNPNGNKNSNNGFNLRETLSQLCARKRSEGHNIVAGINTGFFDSHDGISRGYHIEEGRPVYINNPYVVNKLPNHSWGLTVFTDGTASCGKKGFKGKLRTGSQEFDWYSMNDTIVRNVSSSYQINLYDKHYKRYPHPSNTNLENRLAKNALYVVAEYTGNPMTVNTGYASAKVVSISDGRTSVLSLAPYVTSDKQVVISLSGDKATAFRKLVSVGTTVEFKCDMTIEGETTRPIYTQNATMHHILKNGQDNVASIGGTNTFHTNRDPLTFPVISQNKKTLWLVEIDGRQDWYSLGVNAYELYRIAKKLGGYNMTRFDGGGSSTMWVYDSTTGKGKVVNSVCDSKGERSCLNYMLIKAK